MDAADPADLAGQALFVRAVADFVDQASVKKNPLGGRGLAGVNVRGDTDVAGAFERVLAVGRVQRSGRCRSCHKLLFG